MRLTIQFGVPGLALFLSCAYAQPPSNRIVLQTSTILDGRGGILKGQQIVIEGSRIQSIKPGDGPASYDLRGLTVMPGWIDVHVHLVSHFDARHKLVDDDPSRPAAVLNVAENAWITLQGGFTTVQSVGAEADAPVRDRIASGALPGPRILTSIRPVTDKTGSPQAIREFVRKVKADGADVIKLFATSGSSGGGAQTMTDEQIQAACGEAKAVGLRAVVHALSSPGAKAASLAGCTSIEHGDFLDDATLELLAQRGTYLDPNFLVLYNYLDDRKSFDFTPKTFVELDKSTKIIGETLRKAHAHKVTVLFGTDAVAGAHGRNAEEFIYRVRDAHEPPMETLQSATSINARSLGLGNRIGAVASGFEADLVATDGNPLEDITAVRRVVFVMKGGKVYKNIHR
jgi:imidazolonepropionase-like amidohydrolase